MGKRQRSSQALFLDFYHNCGATDQFCGQGLSGPLETSSIITEVDLRLRSGPSESDPPASLLEELSTQLDNPG